MGKNIEIPDEIFEQEIFLELDSSRTQQQKYIGVVVIDGSTLNNLSPDYEKITLSSKKKKDVDEVFEKGFFTEEEKNQITRDNLKLIDKWVGVYMPRTNDEKLRYTIEDIREECYEAFVTALNTYPRNESIAKFSSYASQCMKNACKDFLKKKYAKKRGVAISLDETIGGKEDGEDKTFEYYTGEDDENYEYVEKKVALANFVENVFNGMEKGDVMILSYLYGIGDAEYEHSENEISELTHLPLKVIRRLINQAKENFKITLYEMGLLAEAEDVLTNYLNYSEKRLEKVLEGAREKYLKSFSGAVDIEL